MAYAPSEQVQANHQVVEDYLHDLEVYLTSPGTPVPFFNVGSMNAEALALKVSQEARSTGSYGEMEASNQVVMVDAWRREAALVAAERDSYYADAGVEIASEKAYLSRQKGVLSKVVANATVEQRGV